jgi:2-succinyl-6-hydroxy-2,4-cyclohexadiene-1-carboxylate synthase
MRTAPWPYLASGNPDNPTLVFLHGFMGDGRDWLPIAQYFEKDYYCVMPDLPGHGKNLKLEIDQVLGYDSLAKGLLRLLKTIDSDQVTLIGYSMGGRIALYFAIQHAKRVRHLILESTHPGLIDQQARTDRAQIDLQRSHQIEDHGIESFVDHWYQMEFFRTLEQQRGAFAAMKIARKENEAGWMAKVIREMSPGIQPTLWGQLSEVSMATLLIAGARDRKYTHIINKTAEKISQAAVSVIPNVGHNVHIEARKEFCTQVTNFLEEQTLKTS